MAFITFWDWTRFDMHGWIEKTIKNRECSAVRYLVDGSVEVIFRADKLA